MSIHVLYPAKEIIVHVVLVTLVFGALLGGCAVINKKLGLEDDHAIEQHIEEHIEEYTGLDIDLTPDQDVIP